LACSQSVHFDADGERRVSRAHQYGFEMVDAASAWKSIVKPASIENLQRIKSVEFLPGFRRIKLNANTCDLCTNVNQGD
jgi:hypothetical protein